MRKIFLIPLMTVLCTVMAWSATVQVGTYSALTNALSSATAGDVIQLTANITNAAGLTITKNLTIDGQGQYTLNQYIIVNANKTLTLKGVTVANKTVASSDKSAVCLQNGAVLVLSNATIAPDQAAGTNSPAVRIPSGANVTVRLEEGTTNNFNCQNVHGMYSAKSGNNGKITIEGNGILNVNQTGTSGCVFSTSTSTGGLYVVNAPNAHFNARSAETMYYYKSATVKAIVTLNAGYYNYQPSADKIGEGKEAQLVTEGTYAGAYQIVNAPAAAQVGETEYQTFAEAFAAVPADGTIKLLKNITEAPSSDLTIAKNLTINGQGFSLDKKIVINENKSLTLKNITVSNSEAATSPNGTVTLADGAELVLDGATITPGASNITIRTTGVTSTIRLVDGSNNAINNNGSGCLYIWDRKTSSTYGSMIIEGNGELDVNHTGTSSYIFHSNSGLGGHYYVTAPNAHFTAENADRFFYSKSKGHFTAGLYSINPAKYVADGCAVLQLAANQYQVIALDAESAVANNIKAVVAGTAYTSLATAVEATQAYGGVITLWADAAATTISKHIYFVANGYNADAITAGAGYTKVALDENMFSFNSTAAASFAEFLAAEGEASFTLTEDINISEAGSLPVNGTKTLTIPAGRQIIYARQYADANIVVNAGASLKILGSGSFVPAATTYTQTVDGYPIETSANAEDHIGSDIIYVYGNLVVGAKEDANNQPHFITSSLVQATAAIRVKNGGKAVFNNADMRLGCVSINNEQGGTTTIEGGEYISVSSSQNGVNNNWWSYNLQNYGVMTINGGHFQGTHGAFACQNTYTGGDINEGFADVAHAIIKGGKFETVHGWNIKTGTLNAKDNYRAMYISNYAIVDIYGGEFKVETPNACSNEVVSIGNNDAYNTYGIINAYGGLFQQKMNVSKKKAGSTYPASVPLTSAWYSNFGTEAPLPVGYEYQDITSGEDYDNGYRYQVVCTNPDTKAVKETTETTIPWQRNTTWNENSVPETTTIVTIPAGKEVVVSKNEADKNAVADQIFINDGGELTVQSGTTLTVGDGGVNISFGGSVTVEPGATVKIGEAGIITAEENALVLESNDDAQAVLLYDPDVPENTQPKATVKLTTKARQIGANSYVFERFAIPTIDGSATTYSIEGGIPTTGLYNDAPSFLQAVWEWNNASDEWQQLSQFKDMKPFQGYQLTNNSASGGLVYVFEGNLVGNQSKDYEFVENGFHFFGNSYSADINIKSFLNSLAADVEKTVWVYDPYDKTFKTITERMANGRVKYGNDEPIKDIRSMQAFLMYLSDGESGTANVNYASAIWGNPKYNGGTTPTPAPARHEATNEDWVTIRVSAANGLKDEVILNQSEDFTAAFENGADANKFMNNENINLYAVTNAGNLAVVATDDLNNTVLTFAAGNADEYTLHFNDIEGYEFTLRDNVTGATVLMTEGATYTFAQEANTTIPARFEVFGGAKMPTAIDSVEAAAKANGIYTVTGQFLGHDFSNLPAGVYVVNGVKIVK